MSSYTETAQAAFKSVPCPNPKFLVDVVEYPDYPGLIFVQTYESIIQSLNESEKIQFAEYLYACRDAIRLVTPCDLIKRDRLPPDLAVIKQAREAMKRRREANGM